MNDVGHYLKEWRIHRGLNQEAVAVKMNQTHGRLSKLERGKIKYTQNGLEDLAKIYGVQPIDLLQPPPNPDDPEAALYLLIKRIKHDGRVAIALKILTAAFEGE